jgi:hypothetical protein
MWLGCSMALKGDVLCRDTVGGELTRLQYDGEWQHLGTKLLWAFPGRLRIQWIGGPESVDTGQSRHSLRHVRDGPTGFLPDIQ